MNKQAQKLNQILSEHMQRKRDFHNKLNKEEEILNNKLEEIKKERLNFIEEKARAESYPFNSDFCPVCFVDRNIKFHMKPIASDSNLDKFKCRHCNLTFEIEG